MLVPNKEPVRHGTNVELQRRSPGPAISGAWPESEPGKCLRGSGLGVKLRPDYEPKLLGTEQLKLEPL